MENEQLQQPFYGNRFMAFTREINKDAESINVSISSEQAVKRFDWRTGEYYDEILGHEPGNVDLTRISELGATLLNHNPDNIVGPFRNAALDETKHECRGDISFDPDEESQKIKGKVDNGTLRGISVGYVVKSWEIVGAGEKSSCGRHMGPCRIARQWEPYEVSLTPVPADMNVGVGRSINLSPEVVEELRKIIIQPVPQQTVESVRSLDSYKRELEMLEAEI